MIGKLRKVEERKAVPHLQPPTTPRNLTVLRITRSETIDFKQQSVLETPMTVRKLTVLRITRSETIDCKQQSVLEAPMMVRNFSKVTGVNSSQSYEPHDG